MYALLRTGYVPFSLVYPGGGPCPKKIPDMMLPGWLSYTVLISYVQKDWFGGFRWAGMEV